MPSPVTNILGTAATLVVTPTHARDNHMPSHAQVAQASQIQAERASAVPRVSDSERGVQVPKKVEDPFSPGQDDSRESAQFTGDYDEDEESEEEKEASAGPPKPKRLNVTA